MPQPPANPMAAKTANVIEIGADELAFAELANGRYEARIVSIENSETRKGDPCLIVTYSVWMTPGGRVTKELKSWLVRTPAAIWKTTETLGALGLYKAGQAIRFTADDAVNRLCLVEIENQEYEGRMSPNVKKTLPWPENKGGKGAKFKPMGFNPAPSPRPTAPPAVPNTQTQAAYDAMEGAEGGDYPDEQPEEPPPYYGVPDAPPVDTDGMGIGDMDTEPEYIPDDNSAVKPEDE